MESAILKKVGKEVAYPGVDNSKMSKGPVRHVKYYQWVAFMLFFQVSIINLFYTLKFVDLTIQILILYCLN